MTIKYSSFLSLVTRCAPYVKRTTETLLHEDIRESEFMLPNYIDVRYVRLNKKCGGVALFLHYDFKFEVYTGPFKIELVWC